jgi:hypothetical protein
MCILKSSIRYQLLAMPTLYILITTNGTDSWNPEILIASAMPDYGEDRPETVNYVKVEPEVNSADSSIDYLSSNSQAALLHKTLFASLFVIITFLLVEVICVFKVFKNKGPYL